MLEQQSAIPVRPTGHAAGLLTDLRTYGDLSACAGTTARGLVVVGPRRHMCRTRCRPRCPTDGFLVAAVQGF
jgi:hypothetical protein